MNQEQFLPTDWEDIPGLPLMYLGFLSASFFMAQKNKDRAKCKTELISMSLSGYSETVKAASFSKIVFENRSSHREKAGSH